MAEKKPVARTVTSKAPRPGFTLTTGIAALVFALLVVAFFHETALEGRTFVSPDATEPAGFVRVAEQTLWKGGVYPLWNPYVFLGMPSFASGAYNPLIYPPDWPLALVAKVVPLPDLTWMLLYYALGAFFTFLLAREWGARPEGAVLAGAAFVFAPNLVAVGSHGHGSQLVDSAYLPLLLWLATRWMRRGRWQDLGFLALAGGFQLLRGHVQICFYTWMAVAIFTLVEWIGSVRSGAASATLRAAGIAVGAALAFGIAGFYNLPLRDYAQYSIRGGGVGGGAGLAYATQWSLAPAELLTIVVPGWAGFGGALYWGGMPFTDYPNAFIGMVAALLALLAFTLRPADAAQARARWTVIALAAVGLFISFGHYLPLYGLLYRHLPLFNKFRIPVMVILLFQLAASVGLAWGWSAVLDRGASKPAKGRAPLVDRALPVLAALLVVVFVVFVLGAGGWQKGYAALAAATHPGGYGPEYAAAAYRGFVGDLGRACVLGLLALGVAWLVRRGSVPPLAGSLAVLALLLIELWPVSTRVMQPVIGEVAARDPSAGRDDVVEFLESAGNAGQFRVLPLADFQSNRYAGFAIASLGGYHPAKPRRYQDLFDANLVQNMAWLRLLNVQFLITPEAIEPTPPFLREVHRGSAFVYQNLYALPRVTVLGRYQVVTPGRAILDSIATGRFDSEHVTLLDRDPGLALGPVAGARAEITSYRLNDVTVQVTTPGAAIVRLADAWYPDWSVTVDGKPAPMLRADYLLRAVAVPAGTHEIVFRFTSPAIRRGLELSIASLVVVLALIAFGLFRTRRAPPAAAPSGAA